jgi:hypothetical protein
MRPYWSGSSQRQARQTIRWVPWRTNSFVKQGNRPRGDKKFKINWGLTSWTAWSKRFKSVQFRCSQSTLTTILSSPAASPCSRFTNTSKRASPTLLSFVNRDPWLRARPFHRWNYLLSLQPGTNERWFKQAHRLTSSPQHSWRNRFWAN